MQSFTTTVQAFEQFSPEVLVYLLYEGILTFESVDVSAQMKANKQYLHKVTLTFNAYVC